MQSGYRIQRLFPPLMQSARRIPHHAKSRKRRFCRSGCSGTGLFNAIQQLLK